jgi:hypothetical protein
MADPTRLTKEQWDDLEPLLAAADRAAHDRFMRSPEAASLLADPDKTPGYLLLQRLKELNDPAAIKLFRAVEMYHHEIMRGEITAAFLRGRELGRAEAAQRH